MVYRVRVLDRYTDEELSSHFVGVEDLVDFVKKFLTKTTKIEIVDDYCC